MTIAQNDTANVTIVVFPEKLSDGSVVYNVRIKDLEFAATGYEDAEAFAQEVASAISNYTTDIAEVVIEG